jgi:hypothetical protein
VLDAMAARASASDVNTSCVPSLSVMHRLSIAQGVGFMCVCGFSF